MEQLTNYKHKIKFLISENNIKSTSKTRLTKEKYDHVSGDRQFFQKRIIIIL